MSLFGQQTKPPGGSLFGASTTTPQQQQGSLFGGQTNNQQSAQPSNLFGQAPQQTGAFGSAPGTQPQAQQQQQQQQSQSSLFGASQQQPLGASQQRAPLTNTVWQQQSAQPSHQKPISAQIQSLYDQWRPDSQACAFNTYLYNSVSQGSAIYHRPEHGDDEQKWEQALAKRPDDSSIPVPVRGFEALGRRLEIQIHGAKALQTRIHEIHSSCTEMASKYHVELSVRAAEAKKKHIAISQRCLRLATKVQLLRNHGYTMDAAEEELKKRLIALEKQAFDPSLTGRQEEIWARLVNVRERARFLQEELEKKKKNGGDTEQGAETIDEDVINKVKKILSDYDSQITHLSKEVKEMQEEFADWAGEDIEKKS